MESFDPSIALNSWEQLYSGLKVSLYLAGMANVFGVILGFLFALLALTRLRWLYVAYVELFRCTPILLQIVWFFFCVPIIFGVYWSGYVLGLMILSMNLIAFNAEAYRAAIQAIPSAHKDAGIALGLSPLKRAIYIVFPQAVGIALPVLIANAVGVFQQSALVALVGVPDLLYQGRMLSNQTYRPIEAFTSVALIYLAVSLIFSRVAALIEKRNAKFS